MEKIVKHEYDIDATELYLTILNIINDPKIKVTSKFNKTEYLKGIYDTMEFYCSSVGSRWKNLLKNKIPLIIPSTDNYYHTILSIDLCFREVTKIKSLLDYQKANFQGNFYTEKNGFISLVEYTCYKSIKNFCFLNLQKRLSIIMEWVREQHNLDTKTKKVKSAKKISLGCNMSSSQVDELFEGVQKILLNEKTQLSAFKKIFSKELVLFEKPIHCFGSNRLLAYFFDSLFQENLIKNRNWKSVIEKCRMCENSSSKLLTAKDFSVAQNEYRKYGYPVGYEIIDTLISNIKTLAVS